MFRVSVEPPNRAGEDALGHDHSHAQATSSNQRRLTFALALTALFMVVEIVGGILTNSLALLSDAAHMFTDVTALAISLFALHIGRRAVDEQRSYGYQRFEILAAAVNAMMLFAVAAYILYEAYRRFRQSPEVDSGGMLGIAVVGLVVNFISMRLLMGGKEDSLNVKGAYLEVWSDMLGSAGVIAAAIAIRFTGWVWLDPAVAVGIGLWVLPRTWSLLKASGHILLEGTPADVDTAAMRRRIETFPGVKAVHDLHVWSLTSSRHVCTAHVVTVGAPPPALLNALSTLLREEFEMSHTTIQLEDESCGDLHAPLHDEHAQHGHEGDESHRH